VPYTSLGQLDHPARACSWSKTSKAILAHDRATHWQWDEGPAGIWAFCAGCTWALSRSACRAVQPAMGVAAACSNVMAAGFGATRRDGTFANSAKPPATSRLVHEPKTSSPGRSSVTLEPTAVTVPAISAPRTACLSAKSSEESHEVRHALHNEDVSGVEADRAEPDQYVLIRYDRPLDLLQGQNFRRAVSMLHDCLHRGALAAAVVTRDGAPAGSADKLNPRAISQTARTISWTPIGAARITYDVTGLWLNQPGLRRLGRQQRRPHRMGEGFEDGVPMGLLETREIGCARPLTARRSHGKLSAGSGHLLTSGGTW
jgi:hypothetical protein